MHEKSSDSFGVAATWQVMLRELLIVTLSTEMVNNTF